MHVCLWNWWKQSLCFWCILCAIDIIDESEMRDNVCVAFLEIECYEKFSDSQYDAERKPHKTTDACIKTCCTSLSWDQYIDDSPLERFCVVWWKVWRKIRNYIPSISNSIIKPMVFQCVSLCRVKHLHANQVNLCSCMIDRNTIAFEIYKIKPKNTALDTHSVQKTVPSHNVIIAQFNVWLNWVDMISGNLEHPFCSRNNIKSIEWAHSKRNEEATNVHKNS